MTTVPRQGCRQAGRQSGGGGATLEAARSLFELLHLFLLHSPANSSINCLQRKQNGKIFPSISCEVVVVSDVHVALDEAELIGPIGATCTRVGGRHLHLRSYRPLGPPRIPSKDDLFRVRTSRACLHQLNNNCYPNHDGHWSPEVRQKLHARARRAECRNTAAAATGTHAMRQAGGGAGCGNRKYDSDRSRLLAPAASSKNRTLRKGFSSFSSNSLGPSWSLRTPCSV